MGTNHSGDSDRCRRAFSYSQSLLYQMVFKLIGQVIVLGTKILVGSVKESLRQSKIKAARNASAPSIKKAPSAMPLDEAYKILNVTTKTSPEELQSRFESMYKANDRQAGGSFYLQSKIVRALERIEMEKGAAA